MQIDSIQRDEIASINTRSTLEQIHNAYQRIAEIQNEIQDIYEELNKKVNLVSRVLDGVTSTIIVGKGSVSVVANAPNKIYGSNSLFTKYVEVGSQIQIGSEVVTVTEIVGDSELTVSPSLSNAYSDVFYGIIKQTTHEQLSGDFEFGQINGRPFRGVISQDSSLEHYGRIAFPSDVINLGTAQKLVQPAMNLAQNAIRRTGDTIGDTNPNSNNTKKLVYSYGTTDFKYINTVQKYENSQVELDSKSTIRWLGIPTGDPDLVNVKYINDKKAETNPAYWTCPGVTFSSINAGGGMALMASPLDASYLSGLAAKYALNATDGFEESENFPIFAKIENGKLIILKKCTVTINLAVSLNHAHPGHEAQSMASQIILSREGRNTAIRTDVVEHGGSSRNRYSDRIGMRLNCYVTKLLKPKDEVHLLVCRWNEKAGELLIGTDIVIFPTF